MSQVDVRHPAASQQAQDLIAFVKQFAYHSVITSDRYYHWHVSEPHLGSLMSRPAVINATRILHRFSAAWITVRTIEAATFPPVPPCSTTSAATTTWGASTGANPTNQE